MLKDILLLYISSTQQIVQERLYFGWIAYHMWQMRCKIIRFIMYIIIINGVCNIVYILKDCYD